MRRLKLLLSAIALVTVFAMAPAANSAVVIKGVSTSSGFRWKPTITNVAHGTKVVWKAVVGTHTVTAYSKNWSKNVTISAGQTTSHIFKSAGTYRFRCLFHSHITNGKCVGMCGKVVVG